MLVIYGYSGGSACDEDDERCGDEGGSDSEQYEAYLVSFGVYVTSTPEAAKTVAAKALGHGSVADWYRSLDCGREVPISIQTEERTFRSLSQEQWERLAIIADS